MKRNFFVFFVTFVVRAFSVAGGRKDRPYSSFPDCRVYLKNLATKRFLLEEPIVQPPARRNKSAIPPWVVMAATGPDLERLRKGLSLADGRGERLYLSRIYKSAQTTPRCCLVGPFMGAPQAAMLMETLAAWGGAHFVFVGWCGAIHPQLQTGDILLPTSAFVDEGTSRGYGIEADQVFLPSPELHATLKGFLDHQGLPVREGAVWSTDAVFSETPSKVRAFRELGALAVEMELSACLTVARRRRVGMAAVLVVSDELSDLRWRPGFGDPRFKQACHAVGRAIEVLWQTR